MPRYFFSNVDGDREKDEEGVELKDHGAARKEAIRFAGAMLGDEPDLLRDGRDFRVEATNDKGDLLFTVITLAVDAPASGSSS